MDNDPNTLESLINERVVFDTTGPMIYIGTLKNIEPQGYWLVDTDVHDRTDGHSTKEMYINDACELERSGGRRINRRRVFVDRQVVSSISRIADVVAEDEHEDWLPN